MFRDFRCSSPGSRLLALARALAATTALAVMVGTVRADVTWHADLDAARAACKASGKPVLAVFRARWDAAAADPAADVLASPAVEAVIAACFEPVRLDVDQHAELARRLAVAHVPSARVLDDDATLMASFDCPATATEFVAVAARAAQVAAAGGSAGAAASIADGTNAFSRRGGAEHETASAVSAKVRQLSSFAESEPVRAAPSADGNAIAATQAPPSADFGTRYSEPPAAPALATSPPPWRSEQPVPVAQSQPGPAAEPPIAAAAAPAVPASLEPQPSAPTSWLAGSQPATSPPPSLPVQAPGTTAADNQALAVTAPAAPAAPAAPVTPAEPATEPQSNFWTTLQKPWSIFTKSSTKPAIEPPAPPPTLPPARPQLPAALVRSEPPADQHGPMPLGLEGYCPVTVVERGSWVEGRPQWGARHRGRTYLFAGPEQQQAFLADPDRYAPALSGDDPVLAFENGRSEPGRRAYGVSYQSRMYLFSSPETRAAFTADPDRFTSRVMIAEGTAPADGIRRF